MSRRSRGKLKWQQKDKDNSDSDSSSVAVKPVTETYSKETPNYASYRFPALVKFYDQKYKFLLWIPIILLVLALGQIFAQYAITGDFLNKAVSLKGGTSMTFAYAEEVDVAALQSALIAEGYHVSVRRLENAGERIGFIVDSDLTFTDDKAVGSLVTSINRNLNTEFSNEEYSIEGVGAALGESFFRQTLIALAIAFVCMGVVVFLFFRTIVPSLAVILAAFSDIVITLAIVNVLGIQVSTAGVAAFLMLIGYSVDTDIILSTRVLKRKYKYVLDPVLSAFRTGMIMNMTTFAAVVITLLFTQSDVIRQIMIIIFIGLFVDMINTWIQNVAILRIYVEMKGKQ